MSPCSKFRSSPASSAEQWQAPRPIRTGTEPLDVHDEPRSNPASAEPRTEPLDIAKAQALDSGSGLAVHGTYRSEWASIVRSGGLSRMDRSHIHLALALPDEDHVIPGMRRCEVAIWVDVAQCVRDGLLFFVAADGVLLAAGQGDAGTLPGKYFARVVDRQSGRLLMSRPAQRSQVRGYGFRAA